MSNSSQTPLPQGSSSSRSARRQHHFFALCTIFAVMLCRSEALSTLHMAAYKPPVKSSVSRIRNNRYSSEHGYQSSPQSRSPTRKSAYAGALAPPSTQQRQQQRSFESRMRDLVLGSPSKPNTKTPPPQQSGARTLPSNVLTVETLQDYKKIVGDEQDKIVAVRFHAPWCRACKAMAPMFYHLANKHQDVVFVDVPCTPKNSNLSVGLGVQKLPYGHIYDPQNGLVDELCVTKKHMTEFEDKLQSCIDNKSSSSNNNASP